MLKFLEASNRYYIGSIKIIPLIPFLHNHLPFSLLNTRSKFSISNPAIDFILDEIQQRKSSEPVENSTQFTPQHLKTNIKATKELSRHQTSHPWPEWVDLMKQLMERGYFLPDEVGNMGGKEYNQIRTACLNFARDHLDLIRYFSRKDIRVLAGYGCPSVDRKVVNSGKRLREYAGIDEGNICSSCSLRGNCERAYMKAHKGEDVNSVDVMRILVTYGLDLVTSPVDNKSSLDKNVFRSVRRLLKEMMEFSVKEPLETTIPSTRNSPGRQKLTHWEKEKIHSPMKQGKWMCLKCNFINSSRNVKCEGCEGLFRERTSEIGPNQDHLMKTGDWICYKCNFLNYAKNTRCLQCKEKPPTRQLNPGEWECDSCNYINFRRNMSCMKCDYKRPKALYNAQAFD